MGNDWRVVCLCSLNLKSAAQNEFHQYSIHIIPLCSLHCFGLCIRKTCKKGPDFGRLGILSGNLRCRGADKSTNFTGKIGPFRNVCFVYGIDFTCQYWNYQLPTLKVLKITITLLRPTPFCSFGSRFTVRLAKSQSQLACDIKSQRVKSNQMRFIFGWIAVLCLGADAFRASLKENWQDKLVCECKEVESMKDCPDYKKKEGGFPPSFPRFYHHQVQTSTKYVNYCCGFKSKKSWWQRKKIQKEKEMCLVERRPFQSNRCCHAEKKWGYMAELPLQIKSAKVYSSAHPAVYKFNGKKFEDLTFDDYKLKSKVFFELQDISGIETIGGFLSEDETIDVLTDFRERFSGLKNFESEGNLTLMCQEDLNLLDTITPNNPCEMLPRSNTCCCRENDLLKAGENVCLKVNGAETEQTVIRNPIKDEALGGEYIMGWDIDFGPMVFAANAPDWIEVTDPKSREKIQYKKLDQISSKNCVAWEIREVRKQLFSVQVNVQRMVVTDRKYCTSIEVKLKCPAGHVMYENVPGYELTREYACKAGLKSNVPGEPEFAWKCTCQ